MDNEYKLEINSKIDDVSTAYSCVLDYVNSMFDSVDENELFDLRVIFNELIINAMKHGNLFSVSKCVKIKVGKANNDSIYFIVEDEGMGFDLGAESKCCANDLFEQELFEESGRGMMIVRNLCDKVKYNRKGNKVVVVKRIICN